MQVAVIISQCMPVFIGDLIMCGRLKLMNSL